MSRGLNVAASRPLRRLPELNVDDSHAPEYFASLALRVLVLATECGRTGVGERAARCLEEISALCDGVDTTLTAASRETSLYDPKHPFPPGALGRRELLAQAHVLECLRAAESPRAALVGAVRERARQDSSSWVKAARRLGDRPFGDGISLGPHAESAR